MVKGRGYIIMAKIGERDREREGETEVFEKRRGEREKREINIDNVYLSPVVWR